MAMTRAAPKDNTIMSVRLHIPSMRPDKADGQATVTGIAVTVKRGENRLRRRRFCNKVVIRQSSTHISGSGVVTGGHQYPYLGRLARAKLATFFNIIALLLQGRLLQWYRWVKWPDLSAAAFLARIDISLQAGYNIQ